MVSSISGVIDQLKDFGQNNMDFSLLAKTIAKRRSLPHLDHHEVVNMSLAEHRSGECGSSTDWTVSLTLTWSIKYYVAAVGLNHNFGFYLGLFVGCKEDY